jgi:membrane protease YdiL (CAAX protease family)
VENLALEQILNITLGVLILGLSPLGFIIYWRLFKQVTSGEAKVTTATMRMPELFLAFVLITMFIGLMSQALSLEPKEIEEINLVDGSMFYLVIVGIIMGFLHMRGNRIQSLFGFDAMRISKALRRAAGLILAAFPVVIVITIAVQLLPGFKGDQQEIVRFFEAATKNADTGRMLITIFLATIVAPIAEEFIFRGFLYGVTKRYTGIIGGMLFTSAIFAAIHMNLPSFPALFVLAVCLNIAYEHTGSLAVPMAMHAFFNLTQLVLIFLLARAGVA